jgi:outer membrane protein assembly factor BamB
VGRVFSSPVVVGKAVYVGLCDGELVALDRPTGKLLGYVSTEGTIYSSPAVHDGSVYFGSDDGFIYAAR